MNTNQSACIGVIEAPLMLLPKLDRLMKELEALGPVAIGFSGGVDSTFLAAVCARCIPERTVLINLDTPFIPTPERMACERALGILGLAHVILPCDLLSSDAVSSNPRGRCYHCKRIGFEAIVDTARRLGCHTVLEGSNADDDPAARPGMRAVRELGARSPLAGFGWAKAEERVLLRAWGFDVWNMPAGACLATRISPGEPLTQDRLLAVRACEEYLHGLGIHQVRVRISHNVARIATDNAGLQTLSSHNHDRPAQGGSDAEDPGDTTIGPQSTAVEVHPEISEALLSRAHGVLSPVDPCAGKYSTT